MAIDFHTLAAAKKYTKDSLFKPETQKPTDYITGGTQTTTSTVDGGNNVFTFTKADGTTSDFTVKNGSKGSTGEPGTTGIRGSKIYTGTAITGTSTIDTIFSSSGIESALVDDVYINISTGYMYTCTTAGAASIAKWTYKGSIKGASGAAGVRGSQIYTGTVITGTSTTATIFSGTGITSALVNDIYINTNTGNIYSCTVSGASTVAKWVYKGCIKGATGAAGTLTAAGSLYEPVFINSSGKAQQCLDVEREYFSHIVKILDGVLEVNYNISLQIYTSFNHLTAFTKKSYYNIAASGTTIPSNYTPTVVSNGYIMLRVVGRIAYNEVSNDNGAFIKYGCANFSTSLSGCSNVFCKLSDGLATIPIDKNSKIILELYFTNSKLTLDYYTDGSNGSVPSINSIYIYRIDAIDVHI